MGDDACGSLQRGWLVRAEFLNLALNVVGVHGGLGEVAQSDHGKDYMGSTQHFECYFRNYVRTKGDVLRRRI